VNGFIGLLQIDLPDRTVRLCDGGFIVFGGQTFRDSDSVLGSIASIDAMSEGASDEIPALDIAFNPPGPVAFTALTAGALQRSQVRLWLAEYNVATNAIVGTPDLLFLGQLDQPAIRYSRTEYSISISCVSLAEWMFELDTGNALSDTEHQSRYPGELGHANATGLQIPVAWGIAGPPRGAGSSGGGFGGFSGGFGSDIFENAR
jgi:hypothetical protein